MTFTLANDPQLYTLTYDFNEIADAEEVANMNLLSGVAAHGQGGISSAQLRGLLYALLHTAHPAVTLKEAGDLLTRDALTVTTAFAQVMVKFAEGGTGLVNGVPIIQIQEPDGEPDGEPTDGNQKVKPE